MARETMNRLPDRPARRTADAERIGPGWTPAVRRERTADGRRVFVYNETRYAEVPLGPDDLYRYLAELRLEMDASDFRALIERNRKHIGAVVLWRLGLDTVPALETSRAAKKQTDRVRDRLRKTLWAA